MAQIQKAAEIESRVDGLTGIQNKEGFCKQAAEVLPSAPRENRALIFFDIDHFKNVNDRFWHLMGDEVLKNVSEKARCFF